MRQECLNFLFKVLGFLMLVRICGSGACYLSVRVYDCGVGVWKLPKQKNA